MFKERQPSHKGNSQCRQTLYKTCHHVKTVDKFNSSVTGKTYRVKATANCKTSNVVYVIECKKCKKQYVGETENALHIHMNGHCSDIKRRHLEKPVAKHCNSTGHSLEDLSVYVIDEIQREEATFRKVKESHWIQTLRKLAPEGLNLKP